MPSIELLLKLYNKLNIFQFLISNNFQDVIINRKQLK